MKRIGEIASLLVILLFTVIFGFLGKTTEIGLAIIAGAISFGLLNLSQIASLKGAGLEIITRERKEQIDAVLEREIEPASVISIKSYSTDEVTKKVVRAFLSSQYSWRYTKGLVQYTGESEEDVKQAINWLIDNGLATKSNGKHGSIWTLS